MDGQNGIWYDTFGYAEYDQSGNVTLHEGLGHFVGDSSTVLTSQNSPFHAGTITSIQVDEQDGASILTNAGVFRFRNGQCNSWLNGSATFMNHPATSLFVRSANDVWVGYQNGVAHIRDDSIMNFDLTGEGYFIGADALEDSLVYLSGYPIYVSTYDLTTVTAIADTSQFAMLSAIQRLVANDGSLWLGNEMGIYHYVPEGSGCERPEQSVPEGGVADLSEPGGCDIAVRHWCRVGSARHGKDLRCGWTACPIDRIPSTAIQILSFSLRTDGMTRGTYVVSLFQDDRVSGARFILK